MIIRVEPWPWQERPRPKQHPQTAKALSACPVCGGERNMTNRECGKCYMRKRRAGKKAA